MNQSRIDALYKRAADLNAKILELREEMKKNRDELAQALKSSPAESAKEEPVRQERPKAARAAAKRSLAPPAKRGRR